MKILIIEDNQRLAQRIRETLGRLYVIDLAYSGNEGLALAEAVEYNVVILDLGLPDMSGLDVCRQLRHQGISSPVIVLTATDTVISRVSLLDAGADDYMTKPFSSAELNARINVLIRRHERTEASHVLLAHDLELDILKRRVSRAGTPITLRRKEFDILECLLVNKGRTVTREMIINHAWADGTEGWNNTVDVHIKHLRDKIDRPYEKKLIKTAYGIGYFVEDRN